MSDTNTNNPGPDKMMFKGIEVEGNNPMERMADYQRKTSASARAAEAYTRRFKLLEVMPDIDTQIGIAAMREKMEGK